MVALEIGFLKIYWYGVFYFVSFLLGYLFLYYIGKNQILAMHDKVSSFLKEKLDDLVLMIFLGVLVGGRLAYVLIYNPTHYLANPLDIFAIWQGGMGFFGGVVGVVLAVYLLTRNYKFQFKDYKVLMDLIVSFVPFGIMLGRIGNFLNQELVGKPVEQLPILIDGRFGLKLVALNLFHVYEKVDLQMRVNTNFIESFGEGFLILVVLQIVFWKQVKSGYKNPGIISGIFLVMYGIVRFLVEFLREYGPSEFIGILTKTQYMMIGFVVIGAYLIWTSYRGKANN
ncbi:MAG: prolipoprotein diacylglyceryl transferase [Candidatus Absconditabacteria bacterium]